MSEISLHFRVDLVWPLSYRVSKLVSNCLGAKKLDPKSPKALYRRSYALLKMGHAASAKKALMEAKKNAPSDKKVAETLNKVSETWGINILGRVFAQANHSGSARSGLLSGRRELTLRIQSLLRSICCCAEKKILSEISEKFGKQRIFENDV